MAINVLSFLKKYSFQYKFYNLCGNQHSDNQHSGNQHNSTQHNDHQHSDNQHSGNQHNNFKKRHSA